MRAEEKLSQVNFRACLADQVGAECPLCQDSLPRRARVGTEFLSTVPFLYSRVIRMPQIWRQAGEAVRLGDDVVVEVLSVGVTHVRLGVTTRGAQPEYREVELKLSAQASATSTESLESTLVGLGSSCRIAQIGSGLSD